MGTHEVMHETRLWMSFKERDPEREQRLTREAEDQLRLKKVRHAVQLNVMWCPTTCLITSILCLYFHAGWKRLKFKTCLTRWKTAAGWVKIFFPPQSLSTFSSKFSRFAEHVLYFGFAVFYMFLLIALAACNCLSYRGSQKGQFICAFCMADTRSLMNKHQIYVNILCYVHMLFTPFPTKTDVSLWGVISFILVERLMEASTEVIWIVNVLCWVTNCYRLH